MSVKVYNKLIEYLSLFGGLLVLVMSVLTTADIIGRNLLSAGIPGCYEIVQYMLVYVVFFAVAYVDSQRANVRVEMLYTHFPKRLQTLVGLISTLIALFMFGLIVYTSGVFSWESWVAKETMHGLTGGPLYIWKFGVPFGCFFINF